MNDRSSIVKTVAMQALAELTLRDESLRLRVLQHIEDLCMTGTPTMRARAKHLLPKLRQ